MGENHCNSQYLGNLVLEAGQSVDVGICLNTSTPRGACHFIIAGVRKECLEALNTDDLQIVDRSILDHHVDRPLFGEVTMRVYNGLCPMYQNGDSPQVLATHPLRLEGASPDQLLPFVREVIRKTLAVFENGDAPDELLIGISL